MMLTSRLFKNRGRELKRKPIINEKEQATNEKKHDKSEPVSAEILEDSKNQHEPGANTDILQMGVKWGKNARSLMVIIRALYGLTMISNSLLVNMNAVKSFEKDKKRSIQNAKRNKHLETFQKKYPLLKM